MIRIDAIYYLTHFIDNRIEARIHHRVLPRSGNKQRSDKARTRAKVLTVFSPVFLATIYSNPIVG